MNLEFKMVVDATQSEQLAAVKAFIEALEGTTREVKPSPVKEETKAPQAKKATREATKKVVEKAKELADKITPQEGKAEIMSLEDLQSLVQTKAGKNRPALKAKLGEFDASGVGDFYNKETTTDGQRAEFITFVKELP